MSIGKTLSEVKKYQLTLKYAEGLNAYPRRFANVLLLLPATWSNLLRESPLGSREALNVVTDCSFVCGEEKSLEMAQLA